MGRGLELDKSLSVLKSYENLLFGEIYDCFSYSSLRTISSFYPYTFLLPISSEKGFDSILYCWLERDGV
jgi:hypothetical protein